MPNITKLLISDDALLYPTELSFTGSLGAFSNLLTLCDPRNSIGQCIILCIVCQLLDSMLACFFLYRAGGAVVGGIICQDGTSSGTGGVWILCQPWTGITYSRSQDGFTLHIVKHGLCLKCRNLNKHNKNCEGSLGLLCIVRFSTIRSAKSCQSYSVISWQGLIMLWSCRCG